MSQECWFRGFKSLFPKDYYLHNDKLIQGFSTLWALYNGYRTKPHYTNGYMS